MAEVVLCCGKVCSGKSTFTRILEKEYGFYAFSVDEWMLQLYDETEDRAIFESNLRRCTELIYRVSEHILTKRRDNNIALDFGFWKKEDRKTVVRRFDAQGFAVSVVYFPIALSQQVSFMNKRQSVAGMRHYTFDDITIETLNAYFEEPDSDETYLSKEEYLETLARE
ncbi:MAG: ATP-binding protein [Spirochaetales bacterium]|nr:ATP-binding protein [Spirochaetales bacterium]